MKSFIVVQMYLISSSRDFTVTTQNWGNIVRIVKAVNKEEAIGKFLFATEDIKGIQKLSPSIAELEDIGIIE